LVIDAGSVISGGGVTLCIDAMLYLLEKRYGAAAVDEVARIMEYSAAREANRQRFA
jgi:transcriptional regulator GlxA family with amidase domain